MSEINDRIEQTSRIIAFGEKLKDALKFVMRPLRALISEKFWLIAFLVVNISFFIVMLVSPISDYLKRLTTINQKTTEILERLETLERDSGMTAAELVPRAVNGFSVIRQDVTALKSQMNAMHSALQSPSLLVENYIVPASENDCLGTVEGIFRDKEPMSVTSSNAVRAADFVGPLGYTHAVVAVCKGDAMVLVGTGYNPSATEEYMADLHNELQQRWYPEDVEIEYPPVIVVEEPLRSE